MTFLVKISQDNSFKNSGLDYCNSNDINIFSLNFSADEQDAVIGFYESGQLKNYLDKLQKDTFFLIIFDKNKEKLLIINDKFGSNEIYFKINNYGINISDDIKLLISDDRVLNKINIPAIYELLSFYTIMPPDTIFKNVYSVPLASFAEFDLKDNSFNIIKYWDIEKLFSAKIKNYEDFVNNFQKEFLESIKNQSDSPVAIALSGGVDSGGILGVFAKYMDKKSIFTASIGGHGKESGDLKSVRKTVQSLKIENKEIYPTIKDLKKLASCYESLSQPLLADVVLPNCLLFEEAKLKGFKKMAFGFGAEMLLGNLKISRIATLISPLEKILPRLLVRLIYQIFCKFKKLSNNQKEFLLSNSWAERFLYTRGPLYIIEKKYYKQLPKNFYQGLVLRFKKVEESKLGLIDQLVQMYYFSWVSYMQMRDFNAMSKKFGIKVISPFDTPRVASALFKATNKCRRKNKWNKQAIRDMFKPFISEDLYHGRVKSLIVPYNKMLSGHYELFYEYLKKSPLVKKAIDLDAYIADHMNHPEPGLSLMRLIGLAVWYDTNFNQDNLKYFNDAVDKTLVL